MKVFRMSQSNVSIDKNGTVKIQIDKNIIFKISPAEIFVLAEMALEVCLRNMSISNKIVSKIRNRIDSQKNLQNEKKDLTGQNESDNILVKVIEKHIKNHKSIQFEKEELEHLLENKKVSVPTLREEVEDKFIVKKEKSKYVFERT